LPPLSSWRQQAGAHKAGASSRTPKRELAPGLGFGPFIRNCKNLSPLCCYRRPAGAGAGSRASGISRRDFPATGVWRAYRLGYHALLSTALPSPATVVHYHKHVFRTAQYGDTLRRSVGALTGVSRECRPGCSLFHSDRFPPLIGAKLTAQKVTSSLRAGAQKGARSSETMN